MSRETGYRLVERYLEQGPAGLQERARRPHTSPNQTAAYIVEAILEARRRHLRWGAKKRIPLVEKRHRSWDLPERSTVCDILKRHGMIPKKRRRCAIGHPGRPTSRALAPNDPWLGVLPEFIEPGKPQQNGRHERMHRTLKAETTRPAAGSCRAQQRKFNPFREEFNGERPHEALDMHTPASCYESSQREMLSNTPRSPAVPAPREGGRGEGRLP